MRTFLFHPLVFYPLIALVAALVILVSLRPFSHTRDPEPVAGIIQEGAVVLEGASFNTPDPSPEQHMVVDRSFWGEARALRIAVLPNQPPPTPAEQGVRILLTPETAALLDGMPVTVDISYRPVPINAAPALAVSLQGIGPADWVIQPIPPQAGTVRFQLPAGFAVDAIGLRAISEATDQAYGVEIVSIRATPNGPAAATPPAPPLPAPAPAAAN